MTGLDTQYLDKLRKAGKVTVYKTSGGQHRFYRDSLINHIKTNLINVK